MTCRRPGHGRRRVRSRLGRTRARTARLDPARKPDAPHRTRRRHAVGRDRTTAPLEGGSRERIGRAPGGDGRLRRDPRGHGAPRGGERAAAVRSVRGSASSESVPRHTSATSTGSCRNCRGAVGTATPRPDAGAMASRWGAPASSPAVRFPGRSRTPGGRSRPPPTPPHTRGDAGESPGCTRRGAGRTASERGRHCRRRLRTEQGFSEKRRFPWTQIDGLRWRCWLGS